MGDLRSADEVMLEVLREDVNEVTCFRATGARAGFARSVVVALLHHSTR